MKKGFFVILIALLFAVVIFQAGTVFAEKPMRAEFTSDADNDCISGTVSIGSSVQYTVISMLVYSPNGEMNYIDTLLTDEHGNADFRYKNLADSGKYHFIFKNTKTAETVSTDYEFVSKTYKNALLTRYNQGDSSVREDIIDEISEKLHLKKDVYASLENPTAVYSLMRPVEQFGEISAEFYRCVFIMKGKESGDATQFAALYADSIYSTALNLDVCVPSVHAESKNCFDNLADAIKLSVWEKLLASEISNAGQFTNAISLFTLTENIKYCESYTALREIINAYIQRNYLDIGASSISKDVSKKLIGNSYESYGQIESAIQSTVNSPSTSGSKASASGGGKKVSVPQAPIAIPEIDAKSATEADAFTFTDMAQYQWAQLAVTTLAKQGVINGDGNGRFNPGSTITRAEMAAMFVRLLKLQSDYKTNAFEDVQPSDWYYEAVNNAFFSSLFNGISEKQFGADRNITRQEISTVIWRILKNKGESATLEYKAFSDDSFIADWAKESVYSLVKRNIILGKSDQVFEPQSDITRVEAATLLYRIISYVN